MLHLASLLKHPLRCVAAKRSPTASVSRYALHLSHCHTVAKITKGDKAAPTTTLSKVLHRSTFRALDKTVTLNLETTEGGVCLKIAEAVEKKLKRTVIVPTSGVASLLSALLQVSERSDANGQSGDNGAQDASSFLPKRFTLSMGNTHIFLDMRKSSRGYYVNIENANDGSSVVVPTEGLQDFQSAMQAIFSVSNALNSCCVATNDTGGPSIDNAVLRDYIFVSGLSPTTSSESLNAHFSAVGHVEKAVVFANTLSDGTISSLGCGVVVFSTSEEAVRAADALRNSILDNSVLQCHVIDFADKTTVDEPSKEIARVLHPHKVFVGGLPKEITTDEISTLFAEAGTVKSVEILVSKKGHVLGFAEVEFSDPEGAQAALAKLNGREMEGRWIYVRELFVHADQEVGL